VYIVSKIEKNMPVNLNALIRYHTIDKCLQNKFRKYTLEDLCDTCAEVLNENRGTDKVSVGKRTIEEDLRIMRSETLGYNAPIVCENGIYRYSEKKYSIRNCSLSQKDMENIGMAIQILKQYRGFQQLEDIDSIFDKMETNILLKTKGEIDDIVDFEKVPEYKGIQFLGKLIDLILEKKAIEINYQRFQQESTKRHIIHPYFIKEYAHRWYLIGLSEKRNDLQTFALDRIAEINPTEITYIPNTSFSSKKILKNIIGISMFELEPEEIILSFSPQQGKYLKNQPLHTSQQVLIDDEEGFKVSLNLVINYELIAKLLSYGPDVKVISPKSLKKDLKQRIKQMLHNY
jgi:predicted DNA-binding transcriptional regulator YafY